MNDAAAKPIDIRMDLSRLRRAAADTVTDTSQLVVDGMREGTQAAGDRLDDLRKTFRGLGEKGATAVRESASSVRQHPITFGAAGATLVAAGWMAGRHQGKITNAASTVTACIQRIPGRQLARDAALVALGATISLAVKHAASQAE